MSCDTRSVDVCRCRVLTATRFDAGTAGGRGRDLNPRSSSYEALVETASRRGLHVRRPCRNRSRSPRDVRPRGLREFAAHEDPGLDDEALASFIVANAVHRWRPLRRVEVAESLRTIEATVPCHVTERRQGDSS